MPILQTNEVGLTLKFTNVWSEGLCDDSFFKSMQVYGIFFTKMEKNMVATPAVCVWCGKWWISVICPLKLRTVLCHGSSIIKEAKAKLKGP